MHVNIFCLFVYNEFHDASTFDFKGLPDKSIDIYLTYLLIEMKS
jgi:hypothetical protein